MDWKEKEVLVPHDALLVLTNHKTGEVRRIWGRNIVTNAGDVYYAQKAVDEAPDNAFNRLYLCTAGPVTVGKTDDYSDFTVVGGSEKAPTGGYPKTDDDDGDNTGADTNIISWKFEYSTGDGPFVDIEWSFISTTGASSSDPILNSYKWDSSWSKDDQTSAKVFANHEMLGV